MLILYQKKSCLNKKEYIHQSMAKRYTKTLNLLLFFFWCFDCENNLITEQEVNFRNLKSLDADAQKGGGLLALDVVFKFSTNFWVF